MTNLNERIEQVLKLDAERTQGEWVYFDNFVEINGRLEFQNIGERSDASQDTEFIASAPEMASIIREQRELLGQLQNSVTLAKSGGKGQMRDYVNVMETLLNNAGITSEQGGE